MKSLKIVIAADSMLLVTVAMLYICMVINWVPSDHGYYQMVAQRPWLICMVMVFVVSIMPFYLLAKLAEQKTNTATYATLLHGINMAIIGANIMAILSNYISPAYLIISITGLIISLVISLLLNKKY